MKWSITQLPPIIEPLKFLSLLWNWIFPHFKWGVKSRFNSIAHYSFAGVDSAILANSKVSKGFYINNRSINGVLLKLWNSYNCCETEFFRTLNAGSKVALIRSRTMVVVVMMTLASMVCLLGAFDNLFWLVLVWIVEFLAQLLPVNPTYCNPNRGPKIDTQFTNFCTFLSTFFDPLAHVPHATAKKNKLRSWFCFRERRGASFLFFSEWRTELLLARKQTPIRVQLEQLNKKTLGAKNCKIFQKISKFWDFFFWARSSNFSILSQDIARIRLVLDDTGVWTSNSALIMSSNGPHQVGHFL